MSKQHLQDWGVKKEIHVIGDPAIWWARKQIVPKQRLKRIGLNFGVSIRSLSEKGRLHFHGQNPTYCLDFAVRLLRHLDSEGWQITMFPMNKTDMKNMEKLIEMAGISEPQIQKGFLINDFSAILNDLEQQDVFIGERLHSVILASCVYTPAVMLEYRTKCLDFMLSIDRGAYTFRTDRLDLDLITEQLYELYKNADKHQKHIFSQMQYKRLFVNKILRRKSNGLIGSQTLQH